MKFKSIFIILILILTISSVSGEDNLTDVGQSLETVDTEEIAIESETNNNVSAIANNQFIGSDNYELLIYNSDYNGNFPIRYDLRDYGLVGPIQNQGATYTCWAQATMSTLESCILKATNGNNILTQSDSLSVRNMLEVLSKSDYGRNSVGYYTEGNFYSSVAYLSAWLGPIYNSQDPWGSSTYDPKILNSLVHVQNMYSLPARTSYTDLDAVKKALMDYGAVYCVYYSDDGCYASNGNYFSTTHTGQIDHAVTIVGWDDTISRTAFKTSNGNLPAGDGAFIVKNSYGSGWGRNGYFYVSYYDTSFYAVNKTGYAWTFIFNDTLRFSLNYQYDYAGYKEEAMMSYVPLWIKNTFTAARDDYLVAFSTYFDGDYKYDAQIYVNGELKETLTGSHGTGYYTIELDEYIPIKAGDTFAVAVKLTNKNGGLHRTFVTTKTESKKFFGTSGVSEGSNNGVTWQDLSEMNYVGCIKAFTSSYLFESIQNKIDLANANSEIFLENKTYYASAGEKTIIVNKNLTINGAKSNGEGRSTLDGNNLLAIMKIASGCSATLININFINSLDFSVFANGNLNLINCSFLNSPKNAIYINTTSKANFKNNSIDTRIYNKGTITSNVSLIFTHNKPLSEPCRIIATLNDDNNNTITTDKQITITNVGEMTLAENYQYFDYNPSSNNPTTLLGTVDGFTSLMADNDVTVLKEIMFITPVVEYGDEIIIYASSITDLTGELKAYINNEEVTSAVFNNKQASLKFSQLNAGKYDVTIKYFGSGDLDKTTYNVILNVEKGTVNIDLNIKQKSDIGFGENTMELVAKLDKFVTGDVKFYLDDTLLGTETINGKQAVHSFKYLPAGEHNFYAKIDETSNYKNATSNIKHTNVTKENITITLSGKNISYGEALEILVKLNQYAPGFIDYSIFGNPIGYGGVNYPISKELTISPGILDAGEYKVHVSFRENNQYYGAEARTTVKIEKAPVNLSIMLENTTAGIIITAIADKPVNNVTFCLDGLNISTVPVNGKNASYVLNNLSNGKHTIYAFINETKNYRQAMSKIETIGAKKENVTITVITNNTAQYQDNHDITIILDKNTTAVSIEIIESPENSSILYNKNIVNNNTVILTIANLNAGKYILSVKSLESEDYYESEPQIITINVGPSSIKLNLTVDSNRATITANKTLTYAPVNIYIDDKLVETRTLNYDEIIYNLKNLKPGVHTIYATINETSFYKKSVSNVETINIAKKQVTLNITGKNITYGDNISVNLTLSQNIDGIVIINYGNKTENITVKNGVGNLIIEKPDLGTFTITGKFIGNDEFEASNNSTINITVLKISLGKVPIINDAIHITNGNIIKIEDYENTIDYSGVESTYIYDKNKPIDLNTLSNGVRIITVDYTNDNYTKEALDKLNHFKNNNVNIITFNVVMFYKDGTRFNITLEDNKGNKLANTLIQVYINGIEYNRTTNKNGFTSIALNLDAGQYTALIKYNNITDLSIITIKSSLKGNDIVKYFENGTQYTIEAFSQSGVKAPDTLITFNINGMFYNRTTKVDGSATLPINLPAGKYIITALNTVTGEKQSNNITVLSKLSGENITKYFKNDTQYKVIVRDSQGKLANKQVISLNINGVIYKRTTDINGEAELQINLPVGEYIITVNYNGCIISNTVKVLSTIKSQNLEMKDNKRTPFKVTVLDNNGKQIAKAKLSLNINGVIYNRTSDENGSAILSINLPKGKYIITTSYNGLNQANTILIRD